MPVVLHHGDCLDIMRTLPDSSVDSIVTDPPYGLGFMGKAWDDLPPGEEWARECLRVLKPGGHLLAFGGTRTWHRLACAVEDAGFEVRDSIAWLYGSGFPKSLDVSKAIDKARPDRWEEVLPITRAIRQALLDTGTTRRDMNRACGLGDSDAGSAQSWVTATADGAHKPRVPTVEQWTILRDMLGLQHLDAEVWRLNGRKGKPGDAWDQREVIGTRTTGIGTGKGAVAYIADSDNRDITAPATPDAERWQGWGTALKPAFEPVVVARKPLAGTVAQNVLTHGTGALNIDGCRIAGPPSVGGTSRGTYLGIMNDDGWTPKPGEIDRELAAGRWPANVALDEEMAEVLDQQSGTLTTNPGTYRRTEATGARSSYRIDPKVGSVTSTGEKGGASRFFYVAKAPKSERPRTDDGTAHPTVKPLALMRWLVRLVTPPGGVVLEPFAGSGTTVEACILEGFDCIAIEREADYLPLIETRIERATA